MASPHSEMLAHGLSQSEITPGPEYQGCAAEAELELEEDQAAGCDGQVEEVCQAVAEQER